MIFAEIILHDFSKPLAQRAKDRKVCGPYHWRPSEPGKGRGFYMASKGLACAKHGAGFDLRLELANEHLAAYSRTAQINGYYCDVDCDGDTLQPIVARLPRGRGFLPGWTMGAGMCAALDTAWICETAEEAALAAHECARIDAEAAQEAQEAERENESDD